MVCSRILTTVLVDGVNHVSQEVDELQIYAGQRYSIIVSNFLIPRDLH